MHHVELASVRVSNILYVSNSVPAPFQAFPVLKSSHS